MTVRIPLLPLSYCPNHSVGDDAEPEIDDESPIKLERMVPWHRKERARKKNARLPRIIANRACSRLVLMLGFAPVSRFERSGHVTLMPLASIPKPSTLIEIEICFDPELPFCLNLQREGEGSSNFLG